VHRLNVVTREGLTATRATTSGIPSMQGKGTRPHNALTLGAGKCRPKSRTEDGAGIKAERTSSELQKGRLLHVQRMLKDPSTFKVITEGGQGSQGYSSSRPIQRGPGWFMLGIVRPPQERGDAS